VLVTGFYPSRGRERKRKRERERERERESQSQLFTQCVCTVCTEPGDAFVWCAQHGLSKAAWAEHFYCPVLFLILYHEPLFQLRRSWRGKQEEGEE
jgi:hypothetical protein